MNKGIFLNMLLSTKFLLDDNAFAKVTSRSSFLKTFTMHVLMIIFSLDMNLKMM